MVRLILLTILLALAGCTSDQPEEAEVSAIPETPVAADDPAEINHDARRAAVRQAREQRQPAESEARPARFTLLPPDTSGVLDTDGPGMTYSIDGSSIEGFHQSLELIAANTSQQQYAGLTISIRALQIYDPAARNGTENFILSFDGQTPEDILRRADEKVGRDRNISQ